jgi:hypothetical protein
MRCRPDGLLMPQTRYDAAVEGLQCAALGVDRGVGYLVQDAPHRPVELSDSDCSWILRADSSRPGLTPTQDANRPGAAKAAACGPPRRPPVAPSRRQSPARRPNAKPPLYADAWRKQRSRSTLRSVLQSAGAGPKTASVSGDAAKSSLWRRSQNRTLGGAPLSSPPKPAGTLASRLRSTSSR